MQQGDFLDECQVHFPILNVMKNAAITADGEELKIPADIRSYNFIVMSHSCDIQQRKIELVLVCPYWELQIFQEQNSFFRGNEGKEKLKKGEVVGYHLLNKCAIEGFSKSFIVVNFRSVYSIPLEVAFQMAADRGRRLRLLPPYREHLSQAFARFFMRVGLPTEISEADLMKG